MRTPRIAIVGGGLSGLYAAYLLQQQGIGDYVLFEAREAPGGRILSASGQNTAANGSIDGLDRIDLGPTWFWPEIQPELDSVIRDLGIARFEQHQIGDMLVERSRDEAAVRVHGYTNEPVSMRLVGGTAALTDALAAELDEDSIITGEAVRGLRLGAHNVEVHSEDSAGLARTTCVDHVLLALPPRLAEATVRFEPPLPPAIAQLWGQTPTWMAPHAKYVATYTAPFWREMGLSGEARSARGPLGEIHDASMNGGSAALFGFFGVPANVRRNVPEAVLRAHCRSQLARLFGPLAATPEAEFIKDWARDPYTATGDDFDSSSPHLGVAPVNTPPGPWQECVTGIASEWSRQFPGYVAGAIEAARFGVEALAARYRRTFK
ncbi:flavin monoamine oxidase family protein [Paraburkholderia nodosa]|uniref:flavin monoamine oxidase family protein n=1 Tax=Paraburkholderia nodosa TaxID=392320 RepID=UPI0004816A37|nr:FAD-dependent oxidoreductase [Paraburkholderia nodosa]